MDNSRSAVSRRSATQSACQCGCQAMIQEKDDKIQKLEAWVKDARSMHDHMMRKYGRVKDGKELAETMLRDVMEENERLQQEVEDKRRRIECREQTATAHAMNMRPGLAVAYPRPELLPDEARDNGSWKRATPLNLVHRLEHLLGEANSIARELETREMQKGKDC